MLSVQVQPKVPEQPIEVDAQTHAQFGVDPQEVGMFLHRVPGAPAVPGV